MGVGSKLLGWLSRAIGWTRRTAVRVYQSVRSRLQSLLSKIGASIANWLRSIEVSVGGVVVVFRGEARAEYYEKKQVTSAVSGNLSKRKLKARDLSDAQLGREMRKALTGLKPAHKHKVRTTAQQKSLLAEHVSNRRSINIIK